MRQQIYNEPAEYEFDIHTPATPAAADICDGGTADGFLAEPKESAKRVWVWAARMAGCVKGKSEAVWRKGLCGSVLCVWAER